MQLRLAGAYRAIYEFLPETDTDEGNKGRTTLNIIAGTSIGAMNAAVLVCRGESDL